MFPFLSLSRLAYKPRCAKIAAHRNLVEHRDFRLRQSEQFAGVRRLRLGQFHLTEDGTDDQHLGIAADLVADVFPAPPLLALDVEQLLREVGSFHGLFLS